MSDIGLDWLFFFLRIIATVGGAVVGWFVCDPLTRMIYRMIYREAVPGQVLFTFKFFGATSLALAIYFLTPLGGGSGLGQGPGKGGFPGKGPGKGGDKVGSDSPKKDDKSVVDPKLDKTMPDGKAPPARELVRIEIIGGERFPTDGKERYYLLEKTEPPVALTDVEDYFKQHRAKLEKITIIRTDESVADFSDTGPTGRLQKLASKYNLPSVLIGP